jgi:NDP-sugar pyrophosphorylase family protein
MRLVGWSNVNTGDYHLADNSLVLDECRALGFSGIHILSEDVLELMAQYVKERGLVDEGNGVKFAIMNFYMWAAMKKPIYGVVADNLHFLDVGKLDALAPAEEFIKTSQL